MEDGLGELGFWIFLGLIVAAGTISAGLQERDQERDKQATLRALLEKDSQSAGEVLAYLRERDAAAAAEAAREAAKGRVLWVKVKALAIGIFALALGLWIGMALRYGVLRGADAMLLPLVATFAIWVAGLCIAVPIWRSAKQKHDAHPDA